MVIFENLDVKKSKKYLRRLFAAVSLCCGTAALALLFSIIFSSVVGWPKLFFVKHDASWSATVALDGQIAFVEYNPMRVPRSMWLSHHNSTGFDVSWQSGSLLGPFGEDATPPAYEFVPVGPATLNGGFTVLVNQAYVCMLIMSVTAMSGIFAWIVGRTKPGRCPSCGYDLRATPGRCPECGHTPEPAGAP